MHVRTHLSTRCRDERGFAAVWVALLLVVIMMFAALAIDGGQAYQSRRQSQNASDAGAMAGLRALTELKYDGVTDTTTLAQQVLTQARATGADPSTGGVRCYVIAFNRTRLSGDLCGTGTPLTFAPELVATAWGVEVETRQTKDTNFARVVGMNSTAASTTAKALIQAYIGNNGSPFVVCGSKADYPNPGEAYDILAKDTNTNPATYSVKPEAINKYYQIQGSQVPICGSSSASFKGLSGDTSVVLWTWNETTPGNGNSGDVSDTVLGITPCSPQDIISGTFEGCGLSIPITREMRANGTLTDSFPVIWTVWQVWGDGTAGYRFNTIGTGTFGEGCNRPFDDGLGTSGMKYCGKLLGPMVLSGGAGDPNAPPPAGSSIVLNLVS
jgi:hypothetical protein